MDHLLEWSGDHPIFLLVLTRSDDAERRGRSLSPRRATSIPLGPLSDDLVGELLDSLVDDLPDAARARIVERAEGIPLYAIETVRSLLDKGTLARDESGTLRLVGELGDLAIPPGLTALIAARLDALLTDERRLVKECAVLGASFPRRAIEAVSESDAAELDELLSSLVRKEVLTVRADRLSPERGQYAFMQSLIRSVAYDTLTRTERKARHLRTAEHLRSAFPDEGAEVVEVIAAHLDDAFLAARDDADAPELRERARLAYEVAAERAETVGSPEAAESAHLRSAELSSNEADRARSLDRAGQMALDAGANERAVGHLELAIAAHVAAGRTVDSARVTGSLARAMNRLGQMAAAGERLEAALESLEGTGAPPEVVTDLEVTLGGLLVLSGRLDEATGPLEDALATAAHHGLAQPLAFALSSKAILLSMQGRGEEACAIGELSVAIARRTGDTRSEIRGESNLGDQLMTRDLPGAEQHTKAALDLARQLGRRGDEGLAAANLMYILTLAGRFDEAIELGASLFDAAGPKRPGAESLHFKLAVLDALRGDAGSARAHVDATGAESDEIQYLAGRASADAAASLAEGDLRAALDAARRAIEPSLEGLLGIQDESMREAFPTAVDAAFGLDDLVEAERLVATMSTRPQGAVPPFLRAHVVRAAALLDARRDLDERAEHGLVAAEAAFRELAYPYWAARVQLDRAEWLARRRRRDEAVALVAEAAATFERIGAPPMLARSRALAGDEGATVAESPASR